MGGGGGFKPPNPPPRRSATDGNAYAPPCGPPHASGGGGGGRRQWHHQLIQLTHLHIHIDCSRNVSLKIQNFTSSLFSIRFNYIKFSRFCSFFFFLLRHICIYFFFTLKSYGVRVPSHYQTEPLCCGEQQTKYKDPAPPPPPPGPRKVRTQLTIGRFLNVF